MSARTAPAPIEMTPETVAKLEAFARSPEFGFADISEAFDMTRALIVALDAARGGGALARASVPGEVFPQRLETRLRAVLARLAGLRGGEKTWQSNIGRMLLALDEERARTAAETTRAKVAEARLGLERARFSRHKTIQTAGIVGSSAALVERLAKAESAIAEHTAELDALGVLP